MSDILSEENCAAHLTHTTSCIFCNRNEKEDMIIKLDYTFQQKY